MTHEEPILICDDEFQYLEVLQEHVREYMNNRFIDCEITALTDPAKIFFSNQVFDLAFLDIQMDRVDGIKLAKELKRRNDKLALFFVTNYDVYQDDAMDLQAFRFFKKPFDIVRLYAGLDKAMEYIDGAYVDVYLSHNAEQQRIPVDDIYYITSSNRKTILVSKNGSFYTKEKLDQWYKRLPQLFFYQVHKSFLVNLHYVEKYSYSELILEDGARIPIAPSRQASFRRFWFMYLGGRGQC